MKVYILESLGSGKYYIGHTNNLERRLSEHNDVSRRGWSNKYAPWKIMYSAEYSARAEAMKEEKRLKSFKNKASLAEFVEKSKLHIAGYEEQYPAGSGTRNRE